MLRIHPATPEADAIACTILPLAVGSRTCRPLNRVQRIETAFDDRIDEVKDRSAGVEEGLQFWGGSRLVSPTGDLLAKAKYDEDDLVIGEVDYRDIRPAETFIPTLRDLRPELFEKLKEHSETL